jgi:acyl-CoA synthetase (AMP-forming)/AMP-acid ligase II/NAD(P)-dependent dehydrogenase (short-subunit alcohol dehydrogenase family)
MAAGLLEQLLLGDPRVQDVCVAGEGRDAVVWVVPLRGAAVEALSALLRERWGEAAPPVAFIDAIPLLESGAPDVEALSRLTPAAPVAPAGPGPAPELFVPIDELLPASLLPKPGPVLAEAPESTTPSAARPASTRPALVQGGPLVAPPGAPATIGDTLRWAAEVYPERSITFVDAEGNREVRSYPELWRDALQFLGGLQALGVGPGERVLLVLEQPGDFSRAFWACILAGAVPVLVASPPSFERSHPGVLRLLSVWERLGRPLALTTSRAAPALESLGVRAVVSSTLRQEAPGHPVAVPPHAPAVLAFSSGSTGTPKGIVLSHANLLAVCDATAAGGWFSREDAGLCWLSPDHVGALVHSHLISPRTGTSTVVVARDYVMGDILRWLDLLSELGATQTWAPTFAYGLVADRLEKGEHRAWALSHVRALNCAGESLVAETLERFLAQLARHGLRQDVLCPMWGMAETSSTFTVARGMRTHEGEAHILLGPPVAGTALRIVDEQDAVVAEGVTGHLQVRGASVMAGYLDDAGLNARSFTPDGWFRTGDLAVVHGGEMAIAGREKELIKVNGNNLYPHEIEAVVERVPGVRPSYSVACPTRVGGLRTDEVVVFFVPEPEAPPLGELLRSIRETVARALGVQVGYLVPLATHQVPKTQLGKRARNELRRRFESGALAAERREAERFLGGPSTLPRCLAVPREVARPQVPAEPSMPLGPVLVVSGAGFAEALHERLAGRRKVVAPGEDVARAFDALAAEGQRFEEVVYVTEQEDVAPLLRLVQTLAQRASQAPLRLRVVVPQAEGAAASGGESLLLPGLLWSAAAETPGLEARLVWVSPRVEQAAWCVAEELTGLRRAREVLWREGLRLERGFSPWTPPKVEAPERLKREGLYLITGALGGVGQAWARYLRRSLGARLLLVGRRERDASAEALVRELGAAEYVPVDVTDAARLREVVREAEAQHGRAFDGAFHFANSLRVLPLEELTSEALRRDAAAQARGAVSLAEVFRERPHAVLLFASSLMGTLGAGHHASYCAASGFVERYARALAAGGRHAVAVSFSAIRETGMARELKSTPPGYRMLEPSQALVALVLALESGAAHVLAGVEGSALPWRAVGLGSGTPLAVDSGEGESEPLGPLEEVVAESFREVLGVGLVGTRSDFFSLGGSSLQATRVVTRIHQRTGLRLREAALFEHPSVSRLASHVREAMGSGQLDPAQLTDEQVDLMLRVLQPS